jgi:hypothetical protein
VIGCSATSECGMWNGECRIWNSPQREREFQIPSDLPKV